MSYEDYGVDPEEMPAVTVEGLRTSPLTDKLDEALAQAQGEYLPCKRELENEAFQKYKYADLSMVWESCRAALSKYKVSVTQWPFDSRDGRVHIITRLAHAGQWMMAHFALPLENPTAHGYASGITYAKRICLMAAVGVAPEGEDDDGNQATNAKPQKSAYRARKDGDWQPMIEAINKCGSPMELEEWLQTNRDKIQSLPQIWQNELGEYYSRTMNELETALREKALNKDQATEVVQEGN